MKIGIDIRPIGRQRTGDETYTRGLVSHLLRIDQKNQYRLYTNTTDPAELSAIRESIGLPHDESADERVKVVTVLPASKALWTFFSLPKHLRRDPVDLLHVQHISPLYLPGQTKMVTTIHDISFNFFPEHISLADLALLKTFIPLSLRRADRVIAVSEFTKNELVRHYCLEKEKVSAIPNSVEPVFFNPVTADESNRIKKKYSLPDQFILYVGTFQPRKNLPFLIQAFKRFKDENSGRPEADRLSLVIAGKRYGHNYDQRIDQTLDGMEINRKHWQESVWFPGYIDQADLPALYQSATIFVSASLYEGFGIPLLEAMASGTPVLCCDSSCFPEVGAEAVRLFSNNDPDDFSRQLADLFFSRDRMDYLKVQGLARAKKFSWEKTAEETLALFQAVGKQVG